MLVLRPPFWHIRIVVGQSATDGAGVIGDWVVIITVDFSQRSPRKRIRFKIKLKFSIYNFLPVNPVLQEQKTLLLFIIKHVPPFWQTFTKPAGQDVTGAVVVAIPIDVSHKTPE